MGAGAIGSACGGMLARGRHRVHLVGRQAHMEAISRDGLHLSGLWGQHRVTNLVVHSRIEQVPALSWDLVLITPKAYDTAEAVAQVAALVAPGTLVASLQNGLGNVETIAAGVGRERTLGGRVMFGAELTAGRVEVTVEGGELLLGSPWQVIPMERIQSVANAFSTAGLWSAATENITGFIWGKLLYNCCLNALSALLGVRYGWLAEVEATRAIMEQVMDEAFAVAQRHQVPLLWSNPQQYREAFYGFMPATGAHYASTFTDLKQGKRTEIDYLNGAVWRLGQEAGVPTPVNEMLTRLVRARELLSRPPAA